MQTQEQKKELLFVLLAGIFLTNALLAELVGGKIFSLEQSLGLTSGIWGGKVFDLTAGVVLWPVVFVVNDVINEYYGKVGVRRISFLTVGFVLYSFFMIWIITSLTPASFWIEINQLDHQGNTLNINEAFSRVFMQGMAIIVGSMVAFLIGQFLDVYVFQKLKYITKGRKIWLRATGSTLISQLVDSFVVLVIAFYVFGNPSWRFEQVIDVATTNYIYKFIMAILLTPVIYLAHILIEKYLGKTYAKQIADESLNADLL